MRSGWAAFLALALCAPARADIVFLNSGEELNGSIVRIDSKAVLLRADGKDTAYPLSRVLKVKLVRLWGVPGESKASDVRDPELKAVLKSPASATDYPDDGSVTFLDDADCDIGGNGRAVCTRRVIRQVLRERDKEQAANERFYYLNGFEKGSIDWARSISGGKISNLDDTSVEEGSENPGDPAYDRLKSIKFAVPDVATGSVVDYRYRVEYAVDVATRPFSAFQYFRAFEPAVVTRLTVTAPKDFPLAVAEGGPPAGIRETVQDLGSRVKRVWEARKAASFKNEDEMPPYGLIAPFVEVVPAETWPQVAAAAAAAVAPRADGGPALDAQVAEIVRGRKSDPQKVEALYDWVTRSIKYEGVMMGAYSYEPKNAREILAARAGDALDKPFLLYVMLSRAGFKPELAYVARKGDAPFEESLPSLSQFSVAAVAVDVGGRRLWLTPFDDTRRWNETPDWLQDVDGLYVTGPDAGTLFHLPLLDASKEGEDDALTLTLTADGALSGTARLRFAGEDQASWRALKDWKKDDIDREFERLVHDIHPNASLVAYSIDGLNDLTRDLSLRVSFKIPDYALTASGYKAFRLPFILQSADDVGKPSRDEPMFWYHRSRRTKEVTVALPAGYRLSYMPPPVKLRGPGVSYAASYSDAGGELRLDEDLTQDDVEVSTADYPAYKAFREAVAQSTQRWIVLEKQRVVGTVAVQRPGPGAGLSAKTVPAKP